MIRNAMMSYSYWKLSLEELADMPLTTRLEFLQQKERIGSRDPKCVACKPIQKGCSLFLSF